MRMGLCLAVLALAAPLPAAATIVRVTYTGIVAGGVDVTGVFGAAESDLAGARYRAVTVFDTSRGERSVTSLSESVIGGTRLGTQGPALSSAITINGITASFVPDDLSLILSARAPGAPFLPFSQQYHEANHVLNADGYSENDFIKNGIEDDSEAPLLPFGIETAFGYRVQPSDFVGNSSFQFLHCCDPDGNGYYAYGDLLPQFLRVSVPEPGSWAMLIAGFGLVGAAARRRRMASVAA